MIAKKRSNNQSNSPVSIIWQTNLHMSFVYIFLTSLDLFPLTEHMTTDSTTDRFCFWQACSELDLLQIKAARCRGKLKKLESKTSWRNTCNKLKNSFPDVLTEI